MAKNENVDIVQEARDEEKSAEGRKKGGAHRKRGGGMPFGKKSAGRPDQRARGGATSDKNPTTAAGNVSSPSYLTKHTRTGWGGQGADNPGKNG